jgi:hypothetical protein
LKLAHFPTSARRYPHGFAFYVADPSAPFTDATNICRAFDSLAFLATEKTIDVVVRNLEIIGEAAKQLPAEFKNRTLGDSMGGNSRFAQPHRARFCGLRAKRE